MNSNQVMIKKLRNAINLKGHKITYSTTEVFLENQPFPSKLYTIKKANEQSNGKNKYEELFKTFSSIQIVFFLRDYWYILNDLKLPTDNPKWNTIRKTIPALKELQQEVKTQKVGD